MCRGMQRYVGCMQRVSRGIWCIGFRVEGFRV